MYVLPRIRYSVYLKVHLHEILDFCFFHKKQASSPLITEYKFEFAEIFEFEGNSAYYQNTGNENFCHARIL
jgi:hypothetical protein